MFLSSCVCENTYNVIIYISRKKIDLYIINLYKSLRENKTMTNWLDINSISIIMLYRICNIIKVIDEKLNEVMKT